MLLGSVSEMAETYCSVQVIWDRLQRALGTEVRKEVADAFLQSSPPPSVGLGS